MTRTFLATMILAASIGLLGGCGGGGGNEDATPTPAAQATGQSDATVELQGVSKEFADLLSEGLTATFNVTYRTTAPDGELGDAFVIYNTPEQTRIDTFPADPAEAQSMIIGGDETSPTIGCVGGPDAWSCEGIEPLGDSLLAAAGPVAYLQPSDLELFDISETDGRTVAGQETRCYALAPREGTAVEAAEYCLNSEGVPLYVQTGSETVEASEFSPDVSEDDFVPPAEPTE